MSWRDRHIRTALQLLRELRSIMSSSIDDVVQLLKPQHAVHIARPEYLPPTPSALKANSRWLQITILNRTHFTLQYIDTYFTSGEYFTRPTDVAPMSDMMFSALSNEFLAGCRGGTRFRIHLEDGTFRDLAIGWANPPIGRYKAGVVFGRSPRVACEYASSSGEVVVSPWTWDRNVEGKSVAFELRITVEPGLNPVFLVEEVVMLS